MLDHEVNIIEKEDRRSYVVDAVVVSEKMECAAFTGEIEAILIDKNLSEINLHNINLLVNENEECVSVKEANLKADTIVNLAERMDLGGKLSQLKMSIGSSNIHSS